MLKRVLTIAFAAMTLLNIAAAQGRRDQPNTQPDFSFMKTMESKWAEDACSNTGVVQQLLAEKFLGTSTEGQRYTKQNELKDESADSRSATDCRLDFFDPHYVADNVVVIYGAESSLRKQKDGSEKRKCQVWTDTWLKRDGRWQIVAAHDSEVACGPKGAIAN